MKKTINLMLFLVFILYANEVFIKKPFSLPRITYKNFRNFYYKLLKEAKFADTIPDTIRLIAIRVEFKEEDNPHATTRGNMNLKGYGHPGNALSYDPPHNRTYFIKAMQALKNFYYLNSRGRLVIEYYVYPLDEFKSYKLPFPLSYYADSANYNRGLVYLVRDALKEADKDTGLHFSTIRPDGIVLFHAGSNLQTSAFLGYYNEIPSATVTPEALEYYLDQSFIPVDSGNVNIKVVSVLPESPRVGDMVIGINGVLFHEVGHILGLWDLYDVSYCSSGIGAFGLMGGGAWLGNGFIPSFHTAFDRDILNWETPYVFQGFRPDTVKLYAAEFDTSDILKFSDSSKTTLIKVPINGNREYFLIENRLSDVKRKDSVFLDTDYGVVTYVEDGEYDAFLPGEGVLIWHIDRDIIDAYGDMNMINLCSYYLPHKAVKLMEADGIQDFDRYYYGDASEEYGTRFDPYYKGNNDILSPESSPNSSSYMGPSGITIKILDSLTNPVRVVIKRNPPAPTFKLKLGYTGSSIQSLAEGDFEGNGGKKYIAVLKNGEIYLIDKNGNTTDNGFLFDVGELNNNVIVEDIDRDGKDEVIAHNTSGTLYVLDFENNKFVSKDSFPYLSSPSKATPLFLDNTIIIGSQKGEIEGISLHAKALWHIEMNDGIVGFAKYSKDSFVALDKSGELSIISTDGKVKKGFPYKISYGNTPLYTPPVVVKTNNKTYIYTWSGYYGKYRLLRYDSDTSYSLKAFSQPTMFSIGDINNDGMYDFIFASENKIYITDEHGISLNSFPYRFDSLYTKKEIVELSIGTGIVTYSAPFVLTSMPLFVNQTIYVGLPDYGTASINNGEMKRLYGLHSVSREGFLTDIDNDNKAELLVGDDSGYVYLFQTGGLLPSYQGRGINAQREGFIELIRKKAKSSTLLSSFYVYPNPASSHATLRYKIGEAERVYIKVFNTEPRLILTEGIKTFVKNAYNEYSLDINNLSTGLYIIKLEVIKNKTKETKFYKLGIVR